MRLWFALKTVWCASSFANQVAFIFIVSGPFMMLAAENYSAVIYAICLVFSVIHSELTAYLCIEQKKLLDEAEEMMNKSIEQIKQLNELLKAKVNHESSIRYSKQPDVRSDHQ